MTFPLKYMRHRNKRNQLQKLRKNTRNLESNYLDSTINSSMTKKKSKHLACRCKSKLCRKSNRRPTPWSTSMTTRSTNNSLFRTILVRCFSNTNKTCLCLKAPIKSSLIQKPSTKCHLNTITKTTTKPPSTIRSRWSSLWFHNPTTSSTWMPRVKSL